LWRYKLNEVCDRFITENNTWKKEENLENTIEAVVEFEKRMNTILR